MSDPTRPSVLGPHPIRRRAAWDVAISAGVLVVAYIAYWIATFFAFASLSAFPPCPVDRCNTAQGGSVLMIAAVVLFLIGVLGTAGVVVLQVFRRRSWWAAAATLVLVVGGWFTVSGLYSAALGS